VKARSRYRKEHSLLRGAVRSSWKHRHLRPDHTQSSRLFLSSLTPPYPFILQLIYKLI